MTTPGRATTPARRRSQNSRRTPVMKHAISPSFTVWMRVSESVFMSVKMDLYLCQKNQRYSVTQKNKECIFRLQMCVVQQIVMHKYNSSCRIQYWKSTLLQLLFKICSLGVVKWMIIAYSRWFKSSNTGMDNLTLTIKGMKQCGGFVLLNFHVLKTNGHKVAVCS